MIYIRKYFPVSSKILNYSSVSASIVVVEFECHSCIPAMMYFVKLTKTISDTVISPGHLKLDFSPLIC